MKCFASLALALFPAILPLLADDPRGDHPDAPPSSPQEELARFHVPPGFEVQLVAAEPEIQKPINLNFDAAGRLWVTGSEMYPWPASTDPNGLPIPGFDEGFQGLVEGFRVGDKAPKPSAEGRDTVRVLSDFDPSGHARQITVFADKLSIPSGIQPLPRGSAAIPAAYGLDSNFDPNPAMVKPAPLQGPHVGKAPQGDSAIVYSIPNIWLMTDWDGDGFAESRVPLYTGFGYTDTHGGSSSYIYWIDGWIYGTHGFRNRSQVQDRLGRVTPVESGNTYRFRPDGTAFEIFAHGQTNPFGLVFDPLGHLFSADSHSKPVYLLLPGGYYEGIGKQHDGLGFAPRITDDDHGSSAIGGITCYADDKWPEEFRGNLFNGNPVTQKINRDRLEWHGATPQAIRQPDFLSCDDPWFRPVNLKLGPDGAMYIADFYNPIIGHYEVPLTHPARDHTHGRIWRVVWRGEQQETPVAVAPDLSRVDVKALVARLGDPSLEVRRLATNELADRIGKEAEPVLRAAAGEPAGRGDADILHPLERIGALGQRVMEEEGLKSRDAGTAVRALKILGERPLLTGGDAALARAALADPSSPKQLAAVEWMSRQPAPENLDPLLRGWSRAPAEDRELRYAIRMALRDSLAAPGGYSAAALLAESGEEAAELLSDVSLALPTESAAEFLLARLQQTRFASVRSGESLKHVLLHLPVEKLAAVEEMALQAGALPLPQRVAVVEGLTQASRQRGITLSPEAAAWAEKVMVDALGSTEDGALLSRAIEMLKGVSSEAKFQPLLAILTNTERTGKLRAAALEAIANCEQGDEVLAGELTDPSSLTVQMKAADLLGQQASAGRAEAVPALLAALPTAAADLAVSIATGLVRTDPACEQLLTLLEAGKASPALLRRSAVATVLAGRDAGLKARAEQLTRDLPPEDARLDALILERVTAFRSARPDKEHGVLVFQQNCAVCHRFHSVGGNVGPNLDGVAARGVHRLIEDILDPNRNVDPGFRQTTIQTNDGRTVVGANLREQPGSVTVTTAIGEEASIARAEITALSTSRLSLMPPVFENQLASADLNDLLAFLLAPAP